MKLVLLIAIVYTSCCFLGKLLPAPEDQYLHYSRVKNSDSAPTIAHALIGGKIVQFGWAKTTDSIPNPDTKYIGRGVIHDYNGVPFKNDSSYYFFTQPTFQPDLSIAFKMVINSNGDTGYIFVGRHNSLVLPVHDPNR